ncbi:MAG TPA: hypothetical protein VLL49_09335 [Anaerolineales bacterium]|nr:hypothetical protein [Anaerolineales bacterium]
MKALSLQQGGAKKRLYSAAAVVAGLLISLLINYHSYLTDFNLVPGDRGDTRHMIFVLEHWFNVFRGQEAFLSLQMFYPDPLSLAYADGMFLFSIPYSVFRLLGWDYFTSYQLVLPIAAAAGFLGWIMLLRRALKLGPAFAMLGAILLTILNSLQFQADIGKLAAIYAYPYLIGLLYIFGTARQPTGSKATLCLAGFGAGLGLLFFTSYYPAWFLSFALALYGSLALVADTISAGPRIVLGRLLGFLAVRWQQLVLGIVVLGTCLIPFALTYAPLIRSDSRRSFDLALEFSPAIQDLINVSEHNYVWTPLLRALGFGFGNREVQMGSPILVLLLFCATAAVLLFRLRLRGWRGISSRQRILLLLTGTAVLIVALSTKAGGFSLWFVVYRTVPGASALRALGRILMLVDMIAIVVAICGLDGLVKSRMAPRAKLSPALTACLMALAAALVVEQANAMSFRLSKEEQLSSMGRFGLPRVRCNAFFISNADEQNLPFGYYQLDAMMISMQLGIPTVNGYSGFEPHRAFTLVPRGVEYKYLVLDWLQSRKATDGICELDYPSAVFRPTNVMAEFEDYRERYLAQFPEMFSTLYAAASRFLADGNSLSNLYPQYLEEQGYLDRSLGYQTGPRFRWLDDRYWIGERPCGKRSCFAIGVEGTYAEVGAILEEYGDRAERVFFPAPEVWKAEQPYPENTPGELLMIFPLGKPPR